MCINVRKGLTERGGRVYRKKLDVVPSQMRSEGMGVGREKMMEVGDDNNSERDVVVSRSSICSSGGSNEIVHMYKSLKLSPPNILTVLFRDDQIGSGTE